MLRKSIDIFFNEVYLLFQHAVTVARNALTCKKERRKAKWKEF